MYTSAFCVIRHSTPTPLYDPHVVNECAIALGDVMFKYRIVYPRGDTTKLDVAIVSDDDLENYAVASSRVFTTREPARKHMDMLAEKHGLNKKDTVYPLLDCSCTH